MLNGEGVVEAGGIYCRLSSHLHAHPLAWVPQRVRLLLFFGRLLWLRGPCNCLTGWLPSPCSPLLVLDMNVDVTFEGDNTVLMGQVRSGGARYQ